MVTRIGLRKPPKLYLAEWREIDGITQERLALRVGTTKASISRWETGERDPTTKVLAALAYALKREIGDLFVDPARPRPSDILKNQVREAVRAVQDLVDDEKTGTNG